MHVGVVEASIDRQAHPIVTGLRHFHVPVVRVRLLVHYGFFLPGWLLHHLRLKLELIVAESLWHEAQTGRHMVMGLKVGH